MFDTNKGVQMKVIKNINNNVSLCQDSQGREIVAFGKGIGFVKPPYEISLSQIERTYYDVDSTYISMIDGISEEIINISDEIVNYAMTHGNIIFSPNIVFTLADHIQFAITRNQKKMRMKLPILTDIENLFEEEMKAGIYGLKLIRKRMKVYLPKDEAAYIALHLVNSEEKEKNNLENLNAQIIDDIVRIVENEYGIEVDRQDFNYSRFVSHLQYLLKRGKKKELLKTDNDHMYLSLKQEYQKISDIADHISEYLSEKLKIELNDEEKMYLMLHINRLCTREDCYQ